MTTFLPPEIMADMATARAGRAPARGRVRVRAGGRSVTVLRETRGGFALSVEDAPALRGYVDVYDGAVHRMTCLVVATEVEGGEIRYEYKRATPHMEAAALDYVRAVDAPVALIAH
ncbi:MAG: hypothetical protein ACU0BS_13215 [Hasllibacter sp.]